MAADSKPLVLTELSWSEVRDHLDHDRRLIVPCGACDQYGLHLPVGASTLVAEAFARRISEDLGVLRAPAIPFGVNVPSESILPGGASLREKTLHAILNDLLGCWEDQGFTEFILLTAHSYDSHVEALATVTTANSRVRVVEVLNINLSELLGSTVGPEHGGIALTSLLLHLYPERVRMDRATDHPLPGAELSTLRQVPSIPADSPGSLGVPTRASAEIGRNLFGFILDRIHTRIFDVPA
jgi:creatinine amidohydrolase